MEWLQAVRAKIDIARAFCAYCRERPAVMDGWCSEECRAEAYADTHWS